jgi:hypothetical protein
MELKKTEHEQRNPGLLELPGQAGVIDVKVNTTSIKTLLVASAASAWWPPLPYVYRNRYKVV